MKRTALIAALYLVASLTGMAQGHAAKGLVVKVDAARGRMIVSCDAIPGYMEAMEMPLAVDVSAATHLKAGDIIRFTLVEHGKKTYAENIQAVANFEPEPAEAGSLTALHAAMDAGNGVAAVGLGKVIPDFTLSDQDGQSIRLSQFHGKVVAITFGYSRCPNPSYCLRLSRNLAQVERRFGDRAGRELVLMTIAIDADYDRGSALASYARSFGADAKDWHFLTGSPAEIHQVAGMFGMDFWNSEGLITHTLHTVVVDREGRLAANIDGNQFSARQLGDLVKAVLDRERKP